MSAKAVDGLRVGVLAIAILAVSAGSSLARPSRSPTVQFKASTLTVQETAGHVSVPLSLSPGGSAGVTFATGTGTATPGACGDPGVDYQPVAPTTVTFTGNSQVSSPGVTICHNPEPEPSETIKLLLSAPVGATLGTPNVETITITDADPTPTLTIAAVTPRVAAGDVAHFAVTPSFAPAAPIDVQYATADETARAPTDYAAASGALHWDPGDASSRTVDVQTLAPLSPQPDTSFAVRLSSPINATSAAGSNAAGAIIPGALPALPSDVLWTADAERPWDQEWANYSCQDASRFAQVTSPLAQGLGAYRIEVQDGDNAFGERCELAMGNPAKAGFPLYNNGDERWISWQVYLPPSFPLDPGSWNVIHQLKQLGSLGTPVLSMEVQRGRFIQFNSNNNGNSCCTVELGSWPAVQNRWVQFTYHVKFSPDPTVGYIEVYGDVDGSGQRVLLPLTHTWTMKQTKGSAVQSQSRIGIYRDTAISGTADIYYDGYTIAATKEAAEANALRPPLP